MKKNKLRIEQGNTITFITDTWEKLKNNKT